MDSEGSSQNAVLILSVYVVLWNSLKNSADLVTSKWILQKKCDLCTTCCQHPHFLIRLFYPSLSTDQNIPGFSCCPILLLTYDNLICCLPNSMHSLDTSICLINLFSSFPRFYSSAFSLKLFNNVISLFRASLTEGSRKIQRVVMSQ